LLHWQLSSANWNPEPGLKPTGLRASLLVLTLSLVLGLLFPVAVIAIAPTPAAVGWIWDWANALGYLACALFILLFVFVGRPGQLPLSGRFYANFHRDLGYAALLLTSGHIGLLLYLEPLLWLHLQATAPYFMLAGLLASVGMVYLVVPAVPTLRRAIWQDYHRFRHLHALVAALVLVLLGWHVAASQFYANTHWKQAVLVIAAGLVFLRYLYRRYQHAGSPPIDRIRNSSRHSHRVSVCVIGVFVLAMLAVVRFMAVPE
jgi:hypothetical protein